MVLDRDLRSAWPIGVCPAAWRASRLQWVWPCLNAWQPVAPEATEFSRHNRFSIDPAELVGAATIAVIANGNCSALPTAIPPGR